MRGGGGGFSRPQLPAAALIPIRSASSQLVEQMRSADVSASSAAPEADASVIPLPPASAEEQAAGDKLEPSSSDESEEEEDKRTDEQKAKDKLAKQKDKVQRSLSVASLSVELLVLVSVTVLAEDSRTRLALTNMAFRNAVEHISQESWKQICITLGLVHVQDGNVLQTGETWRHYYAVMRNRHFNILNLVIAGNWAALRQVCRIENLPQTYVMPAAIISAAVAIESARDRLQVLREVLKYRCANGPEARNKLGESLVQHARVGDVHNLREIAIYLQEYSIVVSEQHYLAAREAATNLPDDSSRVHILRDFARVLTI